MRASLHRYALSLVHDLRHRREGHVAMSSSVTAIAYEENRIYAWLAVGVCCFCSPCRPPLRLGIAATTEVSIASARRRRLTCKAHIAPRATSCYAWPLMSKLGSSLTTSLPSLHLLLSCTFSICCYTLLQVRLIQFDVMLLRQLCIAPNCGISYIHLLIWFRMIPVIDKLYFFFLMCQDDLLILALNVMFH